MRDLTDDATGKKSRQDFDDQQNELAGRKTGRRARFGVGSDAPQEIAEKKKRERAFSTALQLLMDDPEYAKLYNDLGEALSKAEHQTDSAIEQAQELLRAAEQKLEEILDRAPRLPGGKPVFRDQNGKVRDEDGNIVAAEVAAGIVWPDDAPGYEDYRTQVDRVEALDAQLTDLNIYRTDTLGGIRDRHADSDSPMSKDEMREALDEIKAARPSLAGLKRHEQELHAPASQVDVTAFPKIEP